MQDEGKRKRRERQGERGHGKGGQREVVPRPLHWSMRVRVRLEQGGHDVLRSQKWL